ncbi:MAG: FAD binding domain-containing protein [Candidatus Tectomicrobia bacterium]|nr:FAD binding domain-containing protein [Candidatus Tectomicrobia bacterium]
MRLAKFEFAEPETLEDACAVLAARAEEAVMLGGGTDITINIKHRVVQPKLVIDVKNLRELQYIRETDEGVAIGAATTLFEMLGSPLVRERYPLVAEAARSVGAEHHQMMGTVAGNLCQNTRCRYYNQTHFWRKARPLCYKACGEQCYIANKPQVCYATYHGDTAPALMCCEALLTLRGPQGVRSIGVGELFARDGKAPFTLRRGELITEVLLPHAAAPANGWRGDYKKLRQRGSIDFPLLSVAVAARRDGGGKCAEARIALSAVTSYPLRVPKAEEALRGTALDDDAIAEASRRAASADRFIQTGFVSTKYKKHMIEVFVREALEAIRREAA